VAATGGVGRLRLLRDTRSLRLQAVRPRPKQAAPVAGGLAVLQEPVQDGGRRGREVRRPRPVDDGVHAEQLGGSPAVLRGPLRRRQGQGAVRIARYKKGELVHDGNDSDVQFPSADAWRKYIFSMPRKKACDMIDWTWTQQTEEGGEYVIFAAMNISVLLNTGGKRDININPSSSYTSRMYATRDIKKVRVDGNLLAFSFSACDMHIRLPYHLCCQIIRTLSRARSS